MRHLLFIDDLKKLNIKKDSSLMLALALKRRGIETYVFFENDFNIQNQSDQKIDVYSFEGLTHDDGFYLTSFEIKEKKRILLSGQDTIHMRLDPPFDSKYLRILWMLDFWKQKGINVINNPRGIMNFNEKIYAYTTEGAIPSFVGENINLAREFLNSLQTKISDIILKPMDSFSGIGVEKISLNNWETRFTEKIKEFEGPVILQPFVQKVEQGEIRAIYFNQQELGSILKVPKKGDYLSNIAQGATFHKESLSSVVRIKCEKIVSDLSDHGIKWIAFDILGDAISEVNITCPGLLVELSYAHGKNFADDIAKLLVS